MSGIITGPHFRRYFNQPDAIQLGTMVAVLEVGAFGTVLRFDSCAFPLTLDSNIHGRRHSR